MKHTKNRHENCVKSAAPATTGTSCGAAAVCASLCYTVSGSLRHQTDHVVERVQPQVCALKCGGTVLRDWSQVQFPPCPVSLHPRSPTRPEPSPGLAASPAGRNHLSSSVLSHNTQQTCSLLPDSGSVGNLFFPDCVQSSAASAEDDTDVEDLNPSNVNASLL